MFSLALKIAAQLIEEQMKLPQAAEPADISPELLTSAGSQQQGPMRGRSVLALLGKQTATATEPAPKIVRDSGRVSV